MRTAGMLEISKRDFCGQIYLAKGERVHISQLHFHVFPYRMCTLEIDHGGFDTFLFW